MVGRVEVDFQLVFVISLRDYKLKYSEPMLSLYVDFDILLTSNLQLRVTEMSMQRLSPAIRSVDFKVGIDRHRIQQYLGVSQF